MFGIHSLAHAQNTIGDKRATPKLTLTYPLTELWSIIGASTAIVKIGIIPQTSSLYDHDTWTITKFIWWTLRVSCGCKSSLWLRRAKQHSKHDYKSQRNSDWHQSPSPQALTLMIHTYQHGCMTCHTSAIVFTCDIRFFACWYWLNRIFSSLRFYFSASHLCLQSWGRVT